MVLPPLLPLLGARSQPRHHGEVPLPCQEQREWQCGVVPTRLPLLLLLGGQWAPHHSKAAGAGLPAALVAALSLPTPLHPPVPGPDCWATEAPRWRAAGQGVPSPVARIFPCPPQTLLSSTPAIPPTGGESGGTGLHTQPTAAAGSLSPGSWAPPSPLTGLAGAGSCMSEVRGCELGAKGTSRYSNLQVGRDGHQQGWAGREAQGAADQE